MYTKEKAPTKAIDIAKVKSVYSGIDGRCCCGCSGTHYTSSSVPVEFRRSDENDRMVRKVVKLLNANLPECEDLDTCISYVLGKRLYIAYFD